MMKTASFLQYFALTFGCAISPVYAECSTWDDMLSEGSATQVVIGRDDFVGLSLSFVYVNPPQLGVCVLGEALYHQVRNDLLTNEPDRHLFWVGIDGAYVDLFSVESISMLQEDQQFDVVSSKITGKILVPTLQSAVLVSLEGEIDFSEPVTIFYKTGMGTYSSEYWLPEKHLAK